MYGLGYGHGYGWEGEQRREEPRQYTVRQGDSIVAVAAKYKVDERRMQLYNGLRSENLHEGQTLFVDPPKLRARAFRHTEEFAARSDFVAGQSHGGLRGLSGDLCEIHPPLACRSLRR